MSNTVTDILPEGWACRIAEFSGRQVQNDLSHLPGNRIVPVALGPRVRIYEETYSIPRKEGREKGKKQSAA